MLISLIARGTIKTLVVMPLIFVSLGCLLMSWLTISPKLPALTFMVYPGSDILGEHEIGAEDNKTGHSGTYYWTDTPIETVRAYYEQRLLPFATDRAFIPCRRLPSELIQQCRLQYAVFDVYHTVYGPFNHELTEYNLEQKRCYHNYMSSHNQKNTCVNVLLFSFADDERVYLPTFYAVLQGGEEREAQLLTVERFGGTVILFSYYYSVL